MLERGALEINFGMDFATLRPEGWAPRRPTKIATLFASRVLIEETARGLLRRIPNIELIERVDATGFIVERNGAIRVTGIDVAPRDGRPAFRLTGDLIVDASGRATKIPSWIRALGLPLPDEQVVDSHTGYASRWYQGAAPGIRPADWWWKGVWIDPTGNELDHAGVLFPVEGNRFIVTLAGWGGNYPPNDDDAFTAQLLKLRSPLIAQEVALAQPISTVYSYRQMANRWRHYDTWSARLDGFLALGDSTCAFNPVYGQGMTSGAIGALLLRDCLKEGGAPDRELPRKFFRRLGSFQAGPWGMATGADFRFAGTEGRRPLASRVLGPVIDAMFKAGQADAEIQNRVGEVINMVKPPSALFEGPMLYRAARAWLRGLTSSTPETRKPDPMPPLSAVDPAGV
jgi:hypothetical protein